MNIAILSPANNQYSETFIHAHKLYLAGKIFFYYGNNENQFLEGVGVLTNNQKRLFYQIKRRILKKSYSWYYQQFLVDSLKKNKIEVVLVEYGTTAQEHYATLKQLNLPYIVHFHGYDASIRKVIKSHNYYKEIFVHAKFVVVVSKKMFKDLIALGCPINKIIYNVYGPSDEFFKVKPKFSKKQFIAVGRFVDKKAPYYLILSFKEIIAKHPEAKLIISGNGVLWNTCRNLVKSLGLEENIELPGIITPTEFRKQLSESLAFVQHSITAENGDSEGTPLTILEAGAAGIPVIATFHGGIPDIILNRMTGLLVEEHDYEEMAKKMLELLHNKEYAIQLGKKGRERIQNNYTLNKHIHILDTLIATAKN